MNNNDIEYIVTAIKDISGKRRLVFINYEPAFSLYSGEIRKFKIKENDIIDNETFKMITEELLSKRAIIRTMNLLQSKDYTRNELYKKLKSGYYPEESINSAIDYVEKFGYVNDRRYAENYVNFKSESKSRRQIEQFLTGKGIDRNLIEEVCNEFYYDNDDIELQQLLELMKKKISKYSEINYEIKMKVTSYFYRKGYNADTIKKALDIILEESYNN